MLYSALELISQAASNSLFIFCCCNLIIVMILLGSKPRYSFEQRRQRSIPMVATTYANGIQAQGRNSHFMHSADETKEEPNVKEEEEEEDSAAADDDKEESSNLASINKEEDEFRKRIEEFIHKVNSGWKAELLRTSDLA